MTHALNPGTPVAIAPGVRHAALALPLDGWHGRIRARVTLPDDDGVEDDGVEDDGVEDNGVEDNGVEDNGVYYDVAWDSVTLAERPFELWLYLADHDLAWDGWVFAADQLAAVAARDTAAAADGARQRMGAALGERGADKRMGVGPRQGRRPFDVGLFLEVLRIPAADAAAVRAALARGAGAAAAARWGTARYGAQPEFLVPTLFATPPAFGYGAAAILADTAVSAETQQKVAYFTCQTADPFAADAMPYGLLGCLSVLAAHGALQPDLFRSVLLALELADVPQPLAGWDLPAARRLTDWLLAARGVPADERLWWLWHLSLLLADVAWGAALVREWLAHPRLPAAQRQALLRAWREAAPPGRPPANWRLMAATFGGDVAAAEAIAAEMNLAAETAVDEAELLADLAKAPHIPPLPDPHGTADDPVGFLQMLMGMRFGRVRPVPGFLQALAADGSG